MMHSIVSSTYKHDTFAKNLIGSFMKINKRVKYAVLRKYVNKCYEVYCLAFFQWRLNYATPSKHANPIVQEYLIHQRHNQMLRKINFNAHPLPATVKKAQLKSSVFIKRHMKSDTKEKNFLINSFWDIGLADPFPDEYNFGSVKFLKSDLKLLQLKISLMYAEERYTSEYSPSCIYIPNKEIMLKLMRACIEVNHVKDIWFYQL